MNNLLMEVAKLLYPDMDENEIMQKLQSVKQEHPEESDDDLILGLVHDFVNGEE